MAAVYSRLSNRVSLENTRYHSMSASQYLQVALSFANSPSIIFSEELERQHTLSVLADLEPYTLWQIIVSVGYPLGQLGM